MKTGEFLSTPIHRDTMNEAREVLSYTYPPDRFKLVKVGCKDYGRVPMFGAHKAWLFRIIPLKVTR